jgi:hypothetical protein
MLKPKILNVSYTDITDDDIEAKTIYPDIIVHHRLKNENLLVIEMKKEGGNTTKDIKKLIAFTDPQKSYSYYYGLLLVIKHNGDNEMEWYINGENYMHH